MTADEKSSEGQGTDRGEASERPATAPVTTPQTPFTQQVGRVVLIVAAIVFAVFAILNRDSVPIDWLVAETKTPLIVALIVSFVLGVIVGWAGWGRGRRRHERPPGRDGKRPESKAN